MNFADSGKSKVEPTLDCEQLISQLCDQYSDLLRSGKNITPEQFAEDYPDLAETLRPALAAVRVLVALGKQDLMPTAGSVLGDFRIVRLIARGGMGVVYEANQLSLGRKVAIKVLARLDSATASKAALIRFENEIRASASLDHANIVPIYGVERIGRFHFYAMRWVDGIDWSEWLRELYGDHEQSESLQCNQRQQHPRDFRLIALAVKSVAAGLSHAHSRGVIHRDIKPSNLLRDRSGHVWIVDFGLAHFPSSTSLTATGELVGTLRYMSPEQVRSGPTRVDERSDIYSMGATFYQMLTGVPSVTAETPTEQLRQILAGDFRKPSDIASHIPRNLETIVLKMMAFDAADRYQSAQDIVDDLDRFLSQQPIKARLPSWQQRLVRWSRARAGVLLTVLTFLASVVLVLGVLVGQLSKARRQLQRQLVVSHAAAAESYLTSRKPGQRYAALASLSLAKVDMNSIKKDPRLVRQLAKTAATALSLCDVRVDVHHNRVQGGSLDSVIFDRQLARYTNFAEGKLQVRDLPTNLLQATLPLESEALTVCFSASGNDLLILRGPENHPTLELWHWPTHQLMWKHSSDEFSAVPKRFATDACAAREMVAIGLDDGSVVVLDQSDGKILREYKCDASAVGQIKFSNNGRWLAATYVQARKIVVWDIDSGHKSAEFAFDEDTFAIAWSADDRILAIGSGYDIFLHSGPEWNTQLARLTGPNEIIANLYYHPTNRWLVAYGYDGKSRVWDCHSQTVRLELDGHAHYFDGNGTKLGYRTYGDVGVWNFAFDDVVWHQADRATTKLNPDATCFLKDDTWLAVAGPVGCQLWDVERRSRLFELTGVDVSDVYWIASQRHLLVATNKGLFRIKIEALESAIAEGKTSDAFPWPSLTTHSLSLPEASTPLLIGASRDGRVIAASTDNGRVAVLQDQRPWRWLAELQSNFRYLAVSDSGEFVAASERNAPRTTVWQIDESNSWEIESPEGGDVAFGTNDNRTQLITSEQARYRVWEVASDGSPPVHRFDVQRPSGYQKSAVGFSPGLGWIVSLERTTLQVIDPASGNPRMTFTDGYQTGRSICVRSNLQGTQLASVNGQDGFLVWNLELLRSNSLGLYEEHELNDRRTPNR